MKKQKEKEDIEKLLTEIDNEINKLLEEKYEIKKERELTTSNTEEVE